MILESISEAIENSPETYTEIARNTGVNKSIIHRIIYGGSCSTATVDILAVYLNLELKPKRKSRKGGK